ncbi:hypothetical protein Vretimale_2563 [Volvox reticuliferus]|nr:hypothetical protein Vretimale_2563 [Volvox reticuliferus]
MAPRKAPGRPAADGTAPGPSQRPRRAAAGSRKDYVVADTSDGSSSSSGNKESDSEQPIGPRRGTRRGGKQPVASGKAASNSDPTKHQQKPTASAAVAAGSAAPAGTPSRATTAAARARRAQERGKPAAALASDSDTDSGAQLDSDSESDFVQEVGRKEVVEVREAQQQQQPVPSGHTLRLQSATAHAAVKGPAPPPPAQGRGLAASRAAAAAGGRAASAAVKAATVPAAAAPRSQGARGGQRSSAAAATRGQHNAVGNAENDDEEDEEVDEDVDEEQEEEELQGGTAVAPGRVGTKGKQPLVAPTAAESRKRLFELLERRIGVAVAAADGGGLTAYGSLPVKNPNKKTKLLTDLKSNFSVLLYGFGSKRGLLDEFARLLAGPRNRGDAAVLVFHGYNSRCTAREVVTGVAGALMQRTFRNLGSGAATGSAAASAGPTASGAAAAGGGGGGGGGAPAALRALVDDIHREPRDRHAFVVIHNLDGPGLRGDVSLLSELAACPQVHVIASIDHAMAPLLWDSGDAARFRWQYFNATTFQPYIVETSKAPSLLVDVFKSGVVTAGAGTVLRSLVLGAQEVFKVLAEHLLEDEECEGVAFAHLYRMCRERYLVRDEGVLRQHLVEFVDHQLLRVRPASDNSGELLTIPMSRADMQAVLEDLQAARAE